MKTSFKINIYTCLICCILYFNNFSYAQTAEEYFYRAIDNSGWGNNMGALRDFNRAIELDSTFADAFYLRGDIKVRLGDFNGAVRDFSSAAELKPFDADIFFDRALAHINLRNYTMSFDDFNKSIELNPASERTYYSRGILKQYILEDFQGAIEDYKEALNLSERDPGSLYNKGISNIKIGKYEDALEDFKKAYEYNIYNEEYFFAERNLKMFTDSMNILNAAIASDPRNANAYFKRGKQKTKVELYDAALEDFTKAIEFDPNNAQAFLYRANTQIIKGSFADAIIDYNMAISKEPNNPEIYYRRGSLKHHFPKDYEGAIKDYDKALELDKQNITYLLERGDAKVLFAKYTDAIADYSKAIEIEPNNISCFLKRGDARALNYDFAGAIADYTKVLEVNPKEAIAYYKRGLAKHRIDKVSEACIDFSLAGEYGYTDVYKVINFYCNR